MSWIAEYEYAWYETLMMNVLKLGGSGRMPRHIALIMDGNRRYARSEQMPKIAGHAKGFDKLTHCLRWCLDLGIREVTAFAFSIENFKRSQDEVDDLLQNLAIEKFEKLIKDLAKVQEHGVRLRVIGNIGMLPLQLQKLIAKATLATEHNDKLFLNVAMAYTARDEMTEAIEMILEYGGEHRLQSEDIDADLLDRCMYSQPLTTPDLLIRTSGENRLSDFLMWQLTTTIIYFTKIYWPNLNIWHLMMAIFYYQRSCCSGHQSTSVARCSPPQLADDGKRDRIDGFLRHIKSIRRDYLVALCSNS